MVITVDIFIKCTYKIYFIFKSEFTLLCNDFFFLFKKITFKLIITHLIKFIPIKIFSVICKIIKLTTYLGFITDNI